VNRARTCIRIAFGVLAITAVVASDAADDVWSRSYDPATGTRYIPVELILGARWSGRHEIALPDGSYTEGVSRDPSTWYGPRTWKHTDTGDVLQVYERRRRGVAQKFAVRSDAAAIGRVADTRFGMRSCDQEAKYPLGYWTQGETRRFEYRCWYGSEVPGSPTTMIAAITIEQIHFQFAGHEHALQMRWTLKRVDDGRELDDRVYVFAPERGAVLVR